MADPNRPTRMKTAFKIVAGFVLVAAVACWTNPPHYRHVTALYGSTAASKRWELNADSRDATAAQNRPYQLPLDTPAPETRYHDYYLVSTTAAADGGGVLSIGFFRLVIDLRSKP